MMIIIITIICSSGSSIIISIYQIGLLISLLWSSGPYPV